MTRRRARSVPLAVLCIILVGGTTACSGGRSGSGTSAPRPSAFPDQPAAADCNLSGGAGVPGVGDTGPAAQGPAPTVAAGVDVGPTGSGPGSGNPYTVVGARPVPGPDMPATTLGPEPVQRVVASPPNPDVGTPANLAPGETVPAAPPSTPPPSLAPSTTASPPTTGAMRHTGAGDCVLTPGDP